MNGALAMTLVEARKTRPEPVGLVVSGLRKQFGGFELGPLSLALPPGRAYGLLGPNGAGKSTLLNLLSLQLKPTAGEISYQDVPLRWGDVEWKSRLTYIRERPTFYDELSVDQTLKLAAALVPNWDAAVADRLQARFGLDGDTKVGRLSKGNAVKLGLVTGLARRAQVVLLDEPTAGLDPSVRTELQESLRDMMREGTISTLIISSHIFEDLEQVADEVLVLRSGAVVFRENMGNLHQMTVFRLPEGASLPELAGRRVAWRRKQQIGVLAERTSPLAVHLRQTPDHVEEPATLAAIYHGTEHICAAGN